jgi:hypothetical protein
MKDFIGERLASLRPPKKSGFRSSKQGEFTVLRAFSGICGYSATVGHVPASLPGIASCAKDNADFLLRFNS